MAELDIPRGPWPRPLGVVLGIRPVVVGIPRGGGDMQPVVGDSPAAVGDNLLVGVGIPEVGPVLGIRLVEADTRVAELGMLALVERMPLAIEFLKKKTQNERLTCGGG